MSRKAHLPTLALFAALACMLFGFVPLLVVFVTAGMEFAWVLAFDPQLVGSASIGFAHYIAGAADRVFHDWASLYVTDGKYDDRLFVAQVACAIAWCVYLERLCSASRVGRGAPPARPAMLFAT